MLSDTALLSPRQEETVHLICVNMHSHIKEILQHEYCQTEFYLAFSFYGYLRFC